jgi:arginine/lysine/histidine/glutamine transport system substrate-binding and permease protein
MATRVKRSAFLRRLLPGLMSFVLVIGIAACNPSQPTNTSSDSTISDASTVLKVATSPAFPPFESQAANGTFTGFDIDLMQAVGEAAGFTVEFQSLPFEEIIPALQAGTVDAAISGITITPEREQVVRFSRPYFKAGLAIAVQATNNSIASIDDLQGKRIAVQAETTGASKASTVPGVQVSAVNSAPLALQELADSKVDAVINDAPVTLYIIKSGNMTYLKVVGDLLTEEYYGIATPNNSPYLEQINQGLDTLLNNGEYAKLYEKWFGTQPPDLPEEVPAVG